MQVRCPHCRNGIEFVDDVALADVVCESCGSHFSLHEDETVSQRADVNECIGHFELLDCVGMGGFGTVWKARDTELDRVVAVKIPRQGQLDSNRADLFLREARAAAQLTHPGIVSIHEVGRENDTLYIVSDFVEGVSLSSKLTAGTMTLNESVELCARIADALQHAHESGVIHRDIKPSNVMLDSAGQPHVMDFGLAKRNAGEITMTMDGKVLGTPAYMAPEQARGEAHVADARSDVYSLGAVLFQLLTGERPFRGDTQMLLHQVIHDDPPSPRTLNSRVPRDLETICLKCLRKEPGRRYETAAELAADLRRWMDGEPIRARPVSRFEKLWLWCRRRPAVTGSIAAILLTVCVVTGLIIAERQRNLRERAVTAVTSISTSRGILVPYTIDDLAEFPDDMVLAELRRQFSAADNTRRLPLAYALAHFGDVRVEFLVSQVESVSADEVDNLVTALQHSTPDSVAALEATARTAESGQNWRHKARLALLLLRLDAPTLARDMCRLTPDPLQRTLFVDECSTWHGDVADLARLIAETDDNSLRAAVILAVGSTDVVELTSIERQAWEPVLSRWYAAAPDQLTHSATGWMLRQWNLDLPEASPSAQPAENRDWHVNSVGMTMLIIRAGSFVRSDRIADQTAVDQTVTLTRSFLMGDCEVTRAQFQEFINDSACPDDEKPDGWPGADVTFSPTGQHPVQQINRYAAIMFCNWLSRREGLVSCYERTGQTRRFREVNYDMWRLIPSANGYRLPTEAEWEYACRAGTVTTYSFGDDESLLSRYAVYGAARTEVPGSRLPNDWGLFDVYGNVFEWCEDWYGPFGNATSLSDPRGPDDGTNRVLRGGSFLNSSRIARSANRNSRNPGNALNSNGFRVVRTYP